MKLVIVLLLVPHIRAFVLNNYNGFSNCGLDGWICEDIYPKNLITFDCSKSDSENARVWIWTARLPSSVKKFVVQNCNHLELHVDCTQNHRTSIIEDFRVINVTELNILKPSNMFEYLHDNAPVPHIPPYFHLENIGMVFFYKGLFQRRDARCTYNSPTVSKMVMKNVVVQNIESWAFHIDLNVTTWKNVKLLNIEPDSMKITGNFSIADSHLPSTIPRGSFTLKGMNVSFTGNEMGKIEPDSFTIHSYNFQFINNKIKDIASGGLIVQSTHVNIEGNKITYLQKDSLEGISPAFYPTNLPYTIVYTFVNNDIEYITPFSLHPNWGQYGEHSCSLIRIEGNKFDCSCYNMAWLLAYVENNGSKTLDNEGFYKRLLNTTHHCGTSADCTLSAIVPYVCQNKTLAKYCSGFHEKETFKENEFNTTDLEYTTDTYWASAENRTNVYSGKSLEETDSEKMILDKSYYTDKSTGDGSVHNTPVGLIVFLVLLLVGIFHGIAFVIWYLRRKRRHNPIEVYKYDRNVDSDTLITNPTTEMRTEYENHSYHE